VNQVLHLVNPFAPSTLEVAGVSGSWTSGLDLSGLRIARGDSVSVVVDSVRARWSSLPRLLSGRELVNADLVRPQIIARQREDQSWDLLAPFASSSPSTGEPGKPVRIGKLRIRDAALTAVPWRADSTSTLRAAGLSLDAGDLVLGSPIEFRIDSASLRLAPWRGVPPTDLSLSGAMHDTKVEVPRFRVRTATGKGTDIAGRISLSLPTARDSTVHDIDVSVRGEPIALGDLTGLIPELANDALLTTEISLRGSGRQLVLQASTRNRNGGAIALEAQRDVVSGGAARYQVTARLHALDLRQVLSSVAAPSSISGELRGELAGESLAHDDGSLALSLAPSRYADVRVAAANLDATLRDGTARFSGGARTPELSTRFSGTARPSEASREATIAGVLTRLRSQPPPIGAIGRVTYRASWRDSTLRVRLATALAGGSAKASAQLVTGSGARWRVDDGHLERVHLDSLLRGAPPGVVTLDFTARGRGLEPRTMNASAEARVGESRVGRVAVHAGRVNATLARGSLAVSASSTLQGGSVELAGSASPFGAVIPFRISRSRAEHLNLAALLGDSAFSSDLDATVTGNGRWDTRPSRGRGAQDALKFDGTVSADSSSIGGRTLDSAAFDLSLAAGVLRVRGSAAAPAGKLALDAETHLGRERPTLVLHRAAFRDLNLATISGVAGLSSRLSGSLQTEGTGLDLPSAQWRGTMRLDPSTVGTISLQRAEVQYELDAGRITVEGSAANPDGAGKLSLSGRLSPLAPPRADSAMVDSIGSQWTAWREQLLSRSEVKGSIAGHWRFTSGDVDSASALRVDSLLGTMALAGGVLQFDTVLVRSTAGVVDASGRLAVAQRRHAEDLHLEARTLALQALARLAGLDTLHADSGRLSLTVSGDADTHRLEGAVRLDGVRVNGLRVGSATSTVRGDMTGFGRLNSATLNAAAEMATQGEMLVRRVEMQGSLGDSSGMVALSAEVGVAASLRSTVRFTPATIGATALVESLFVETPHSKWALEQPARLRYAERYEVGHLVLRDGARRIALNGVIDRRGEQQFEAQLDSLPLVAVSELTGRGGIGGVASAKLTLSGPASDPHVVGNMRMALRSAEAPVGTLVADVDWSGGRLVLNATASPPQGNVLTAAGALPYALSLAPSDSMHPVALLRTTEQPVDFRVHSDGFDLSTLAPLFDPTVATEPRGTLTLDAHVTGRATSPTVGGSVRVRGAQVKLPGMGVTYRDVDVQGALSGDQLQLDRASVRSESGTLTATGTVRLPRLDLVELDLRSSMKDFRAIWSPSYRATLSGDLALGGSSQAPTITGSINVKEASLDLDTGLPTSAAEDVELSAADLRMVAERFGPRAAKSDTVTTKVFDAAALDLKVRADRNAWVRKRANPRMAVEISGAVHIIKPARGALQITGTLEPVRGRSFAEQFGRRFTMEGGEVVFDGAPEDMRVDLQAQYKVESKTAGEAPDVKINMGVQGNPVTGLKLLLSSEPAMSNSEIVSYLATGKASGEGMRMESTKGVSGIPLSSVPGADQVRGAVEGFAQEKLALDVVEIRQDPQKGTMLAAGRYVTSQLFLGFLQPLDFSNDINDPSGKGKLPEAQIEYAAYQWLLLRLEGGASEVRFFLRSRYAY